MSFIEEEDLDPMFPLNDLPYEAYCKVLKVFRQEITPFVPQSMEEDLATGKMNRIVYWYPKYMPMLCLWAEHGKHYKDYFGQYNHLSSFFFEELFTETAKKLDKLTKKKENVLGEISIKNSKLNLK